MRLTDSSQKTVIDISLYYKYIDENIIKDKRYHNLMSIVSKNSDVFYTYAFYTDTFLLKTNIYIPNFNTMYLANSNHNVIIEDDKDLWLMDVFTNNRYFIMDDIIDINPKYNLIKISSIEEIQNI